MSISSRSDRNVLGAGDFAEKHTDPVLVYCRIRPLPATEDAESVYIKDAKTIALSSPNKHGLDHEMHYVFKQVFGPQSTQREIYDIVAEPLVKKLISGNSSLLFTYGVTGSGKTYTMTGGDTQELGLMPRCVEAIFRTISGYHARRYIFQPDHLNGYEIVTEAEAQAKAKANKQQRSARGNRMTSRAKSSEIDFDVSSLKTIEPLAGLDERNVYAVFISYTEIYNNCVYDLLEECSIQKPLQSRIVREDANRNMYVHGAKEIEIISVQEAMEAFQLGQRRKRIGHTLLNAESSRSHSIFNIRLVQARTGQHTREDKGEITVSQLSLVDLAGSERSSRTNNTGARLREAGNINNSLMTLRTCLEYLRENQQAQQGTNPKKIPYRDSKITQLFKAFFEGEGQVSMIACINPSSNDYIENGHVMKFAEMTQEVQVLRATTVQLTNNDNEMLKMLSTRLGGYEIDGIEPIGDGPLSEKLINLFQQHLEKCRRDTLLNEQQCGNYCRRIYDLEQLNKALEADLVDIQQTYKKECERFEEVVDSHKKALSVMQERLKEQDKRLSSIESKTTQTTGDNMMQQHNGTTTLNHLRNESTSQNDFRNKAVFEFTNTDERLRSDNQIEFQWNMKPKKYLSTASQDSTPRSDASTYRKRQRYKPDFEFDKRESELSRKIEEHHKKLTAMFKDLQLSTEPEQELQPTITIKDGLLTTSPPASSSSQRSVSKRPSSMQLTERVKQAFFSIKPESDAKSYAKESLPKRKYKNGVRRRTNHTIFTNINNRTEQLTEKLQQPLPPVTKCELPDCELRQHSKNFQLLDKFIEQESRGES